MMVRTFIKFVQVLQEKLITALEKKPSRDAKDVKEVLPLSGDPIRDVSETEDEVTFYETENSPLARGAKRTPAKGIDKFD